MKNFFAKPLGVVLAGGLIGLVAVLLQKSGNPANMGLCVACFGRDVSGSLGLHRAEVVQYLRPEFMALVLGAFLAAALTGEFKPRTGSSPALRFFLGFVVAVGALIFLGCPWRAFLRLAGGDLNALVGIIGLVAGIAAGSLFIKGRFSLGASRPAGALQGLVLPLFMAGLLVLRLVYPQVEGEPKSGLLFYSVSGPGSQHAAVWASLAGGLIVGLLGQRSRFCSVGAVRDFILFRQNLLLLGVLGFIAFSFLGNLALGQFHPGFSGQPIAHTNSVWNFLGLLIVGLGSTLAGGCPGRQLFLAGEGDGDAAVFVMGLLAGLAMAHNFGLASSGAGLGPMGAVGGIVCLVVVLAVGFLGKEKGAAAA
jgi:YedE family putative selenium metabolism protein